MSNPHFYYTWTAQKEAPSIEVLSTDQFQYTVKGQKKEIIDLSSLSFQASFGLRNKTIQQSIYHQYQILPAADPKMTWPKKQETSLHLKKILKCQDGKIFYCLSGAEAIENALKMARDFTGRKVIASRQKSYHGASLGAISISGDWRNQGTLTTDDWILRLPEPTEDLQAEATKKTIERYGPQKIAAICLETITGANGVIIPPQSYYDGIQNICNQYGILLILDEVVCGLGRTGKNMGFHHFSIEPDFVCMAKSLTGGFFPMGAIWTHQNIADYYENHTLHCGLTHYAHPIGLSAISQICTLIEKNKFKQELNQLITHFHQQLNNLTNISSVSEIRKIGMLAAIEVNPQLPQLDWIKALSFGISAIIKTHTIILAPALNMPQEVLETGMQRLSQYLENQK